MGKKLAGKKILKALDAPQRYVMGKGAEAVGVKPGKDSEGTARRIVERIAERSGLGDSTTANALKAAGIAGLTVFGDPLSLVPGGKVAKLGMRAIRNTKGGSKALKQAAKYVPEMRDVEKLKRTPRAKEGIGKVKGKAEVDMFKQKPENVAKKLQKENIKKGLKDMVKSGRIDKSKLRPDQVKELDRVLKGK